jgi:hypothetical protein
MLRPVTTVGVLLPFSIALYAACGSDTPPPQQTESTSQPCTVKTDCYPGLEAGTLQGGEPVCITKVPNGYCTHICSGDRDCCAVPGECKTHYPQVCAPFENMSTMMYCFLSCEDSDWADAGLASADTFCGTYAGAGLTCRATGGGAPRKVCMP